MTKKKLSILIFMLLLTYCLNLFSDDSIALDSEVIEDTKSTEPITTKEPTPTASSMPNYQSVFNMANRFYGEGKKDEALEAYMSMLASGINSAMIYYNIGNIYAETKEYSKAIVYYERALRRSGYDKALQNNLKYAYKNVGGDDFYRAHNVRHFHLFSYLNKVSIFFLLFSATKLFFIVLFIRILKVKMSFLKNKTDTYIKKATLIFIAIFVLSFSAYIFSNRVITENFLIIQNNEAYIREGASDSSKNIYNLSDGEKVPILEVHENWYYVKVRSGGRGWVKADDGISIF